MTTPARIAAFLSTSALCLGLAGGPAYGSERGADAERESRTLSRDRDASARGAASGVLADSRSDRPTTAGAGGGQNLSAPDQRARER
jgi:hypothetical protein